MKKANELGLKLYFIYNNEQMQSIIDSKPKNKEDLLKLNGFGEKKYEMYGEDILAIVKKYL